MPISLTGIIGMAFMWMLLFVFVSSCWAEMHVSNEDAALVLVPHGENPETSLNKVVIPHGQFEFLSKKHTH